MVMVSWRHCGRLALGLLVAGGALAVSISAHAVPIDPTSATTGWTAIDYPSLLPDVSDDQRTGIPEADIVGDTANPAFYYRFDDNGTATNHTDGAIAFRVRVGADKNPPGFNAFVGVGIDANGDNALDLFLAVENSGSGDNVGIYDAGPGANTSPSTTTIVSTALFSYGLSVSNYSFLAVNLALDPTGTTTDVDNDSETDYFVTFVLPFADVVSALAAQGITGFDDLDAMRLVVGTSTQPNSLNQDLGGPNGGTTSTTTWDALGALSNPLSAVPEPGTGVLLGLGLVGVSASSRSRRRRG